MAAPIRLTNALAAEYQQLFNNCTIQPQYQITVERLAQKLQQQQQRYSQVERATQVPWMIIAVIHAMESGLSFERHLHNGDPLHSRTVNVPTNRPLTAAPFTWETSAVDALHYTGLAKWRDWSIAGALFKLEAYNGWGYRRYHAQVLSPYLWSFSAHYQQGKYAADGRFDAQLISQQCGAAVLLKQLKAFDSVPTQTKSPTPTQATHPYPDRFIKRSKHKRAVVIRVQQQLNLKGQQPKLVTDGYFGATTQQAVKSFQASTHPKGVMLKADGIVGPMTWKMLFGQDKP